MNKAELIKQLEGINPEYTLTVGKVLKTVKALIEPYEPKEPGREASTSKKMFYPCPDCDGRLLMECTTGITKKSQIFARYRICNKCKVRFKTDEIILKKMPKSDGRKDIDAYS